MAVTVQLLNDRVPRNPRMLMRGMLSQKGGMDLLTRVCSSFAIVHIAGPGKESRAYLGRGNRIINCAVDVGDDCVSFQLQQDLTSALGFVEDPTFMDLRKLIKWIFENHSTGYAFMPIIRDEYKRCVCAVIVPHV